MKKKLFGLIGYPLEHSFSAKYFQNKFQEQNILDCFYQNFEIQNINQLPSLILENPTLLGLNVTIPHKQNVIKYLHILSNEAQEIGAVNTIKIIRNQQSYILKGYNTDAYGFAQSIKPFLDIHHQKALILGKGGAAKAVAYVLKNLGIDYFFVTRQTKESLQDLHYNELNQYAIETIKLIINTSPVGMFPNINEMPNIPYTGIGEQHLCIDLIYNPQETLFLKKSKEKGAKILNGLPMLKLQAEKSWEIWNEIG
jgi:shikimate dehydrogenase